MDLNAKGKKEDNNELVISAGDAPELDEVAEDAPKSVVETDDGGFGFVNPSNTIEEIQEPNEEALQDEVPEQKQESENESSDTNSHSAKESIPTTESNVNIFGEGEEKGVEEEEENNPNTSENSSAQNENEEDDDGITREGLYSTQGSHQSLTEQVNTENAIDPFYDLPKYEVKDVYESQVNPEIQDELDMINSSLSQIKCFQKNLMNPEQLYKEIRERKEDSKVESYDTITQV